MLRSGLVPLSYHKSLLEEEVIHKSLFYGAARDELSAEGLLIPQVKEVQKEYQMLKKIKETTTKKETKSPLEELLGN